MFRSSAIVCIPVVISTTWATGGEQVRPVERLGRVYEMPDLAPEIDIPATDIPFDCLIPPFTASQASGQHC
jgi:hypothetical protein